MAHFRWQWLPEGLKTFRFDIDPTEFVRLPPDVGVVSDSRDGTLALLDALETTVGKRGDRTDEFAGYKAAAEASLEALQPQVQYLKAIRRALPDDGFFVEEITQTGFAARMAFPVYGPRQYVTCGYQGQSGLRFQHGLGCQGG